MKHSQRITCRQILVSLLLFVCLLEFTVEVCPSGYFGKNCHYRCRCIYLNCYTDGNCLPNASCFDVYFGPACQYINLVNTTHYNSDWVHDNNDSTCSPHSSPQDITVYLKATTFMTWFRLNFRYPHRLGDAYQTINVKINGTVNCLNKRIYMFSTGIVDVSCDNIVLMSSLVFSGTITTMLCNIYVSGGRNVVYRQNTTIIGASTQFTTELAVDDNTYCQVAKPEVAKKIIIDVPNPHLLYRILIYLPYATTTNHNFLMQMYSGPNLTISRTVTTVAAYKVNVFMLDWTPFTRLSIQITPQVEICEVQATGETWCELTQYGYECEHTCKCLPNEICFPPTGMCGPECPPGSYGFLCSLRCGNCQTNKCDYRTGKCKCNDGYKDDGICLTQCSQGTYGRNCSGKCSGHCKGTSGCDRVSGNCTDCVDGYFGSRCHLQCPTHCKSKKCNRVTGKCASCENGYFNENCSLQCPNGCANSICDFTKGSCLSCKATRFGVQACPASVCQGSMLSCHQTCSSGCLNKICNQTTGKCASCAPAYAGPNCTPKGCPANCKTTTGCNNITDVCHDCKDGYFGPSCQSNCSSNCMNGLCNKATGHCSSCKTGYYGSSCQSSCPSNCLNSVCDKATGHCSSCKTGYYGSSCQSSCSSNCLNSVCDKATGHCSSCKTGYYGSSCQSSCSSNCLNNVCNKATGHCSSCKTGYYGSSCQSSCPSNCLNSVCDKATGHCSSCKTGYYGSSCQSSCPSNCMNSVCNKATGHCSSCKAGYFGLNCSMRCQDGCLNSLCNFTTGSCLQCKTSRFGTQSCAASVCQGTILSCHLTCSGGCLNDVCNQTDGICGSCKPGFVGATCSPKGCPVNCNATNGCDQVTSTCRGCNVGFFSPSCKDICPKHCLGGACNQATGNCSSCEIGYFDPNCSSDCPTGCLDSTCDFITGRCLECQRGMFGVAPCQPSGCSGQVLVCNQSCSVGCVNQTCGQTSGECAACNPGFEGRTCISKDCPPHCKNQNGCDKVDYSCFDCADGYFGSACQFVCSKSCKGDICVQESGECFDCEKGYFGPNCSEKCPRGCLNSECNVTTGECFQCKTGRYGERNCTSPACNETILVCNKLCSEGCLDGSCNQTTGLCFACAPSFETPACTAVKDSLSLLWLAALLLPLLLLLCILAFCCYKKVITSAEEESKGSIGSKASALPSQSSSWTFATSYVTVYSDRPAEKEHTASIKTSFEVPSSQHQISQPKDQSLVT